MGDDPRYLSTAQVAETLGLSVTTIKRWVDDGVLAARKTVGGHRKVLVADVLRLMRESELPEADLSKLFPRPRKAGVPNPDAVSAQLLTALKAADQPAVRALLHGAFRHGLAMDVLADRVVTPALDRLETERHAGRIGVMHEHRALQVIVAALYELAEIIRVEPDRGRPVAVGGAPESDPTLVATLLANLVLLDAGWEAVNLGPDNPVGAFVTAINDLRPRLVWVCVSRLPELDAFLRDCDELYHEARGAGTALAVGGRALSRETLDKMPFATFGAGMGQLAAYARTLFQRPGVPKKGRPPRARRERRSRAGH
ncbi:MAG TPA: helix-turn-helix domain-containing protein [Gemmataceae bacterium]|nr:helix-turn-helix domain-containing protein [Gemmataceae bacterium]